MRDCTKLLVVEDNEQHSFLIENKFREAFPEAEVVTVRSLEEATKALPKNYWDLIIVETRLPDGRGTDLLPRIAAHQPLVAVAVLTEDPAHEEIPESAHHGAVQFLRKDRQTLETFQIHAHRLIAVTRRMQRLLNVQPGTGTSLTFRDPVTQVYNRHFFEEALQREAAQSNRYGQEFALLSVDLDDYPNLLQRQGEPEAERCLQKLASILRRSVRMGDIVALYEEAQFMLLLSQCHKEDAVRCAGRILQQIQKEPGRRPFTVSIGVVHYHGKVCHPKKVLMQAGSALHRAKKEGGNRYVIAA